MPPRSSIIRQRLAARRPVLCFKSNIPHLMVPELLGGAGIDCLWLDTEHFPTSAETMAGLVMACRATDTDSMVRVPNGQFGLAAKMFDLGADGVMYPRCRNVAEVRTLVDWTRFAPVGRRGADNGVAAASYGGLSADESIAHARANNILMVQIETPEALAAVDEIAAVPGVDILFVGPGDLALELGVPCDPANPVLADAIARVGKAADRRGIAWGMPAFSLDHGRKLIDAGARFVNFGSDTSVLMREVRSNCKAFAGMGVEFGRGK